MEGEREMTWFEALVRTGVLDRLRRSRHSRQRAEGIAAQAVIIGVTAVIGTAILTAFMNGMGQVLTAMLKQIGSIVPGGVTPVGG
jgi:hypothetical protein